MSLPFGLLPCHRVDEVVHAVAPGAGGLDEAHVGEALERRGRGLGREVDEARHGVDREARRREQAAPQVDACSGDVDGVVARLEVLDGERDVGAHREVTSAQAR